MHHLLTIGPLSYFGIGLILFFIISFFIKKDNILTKPQSIEYQNLKVQVTLNILIFLGGVIFLFYDYINNYQSLNKDLKVANEELAKKQGILAGLEKAINEKEKVNYDFFIQLEAIGNSQNFPESSDLTCFYKETNASSKREAVIDNSENGGNEGTYRVYIYNIQQLATIPYLEVVDKKGNKWLIEENIEIRPPLVQLILKK